MLDLYDDVSFVLIGDSGRHDPEIYASVVAEHPGRVEAVYIRDVSGTHRRSGEIQELARSVSDAGSSLLLAEDCLTMARHAASLGLMTGEERVAAEG